MTDGAVNLQALQRKRSAVKGQLTRLAGVLAAAEVDVAPVPASRILYYRDQAKELWDRLMCLQDDISVLCTDEDYVEQEAEFNQIASRFDDFQYRIQTLLGPVAPPAGRQGDQQLQSDLSLRAGGEIKLPKLQLPPFSGNYQEWPSFHDLYVSLVHNSNAYSKVQKLSYLKLALRGEAAQLIQSIQITEANYDEAWTLLTTRYQNKREIVRSYLQQLLSQPNLQCESSTQLRKLLDTTQEMTRSLRALEVPVDQWDVILCHIIAEKLDSTTRREWEQSIKNTNDFPTFDQFLTFLDQQTRILMACSSTKDKSVKVPYVDGKTSHFATTSNNLQCPLCPGENHGVFRCPKYLAASLNDKKKLIAQHNLCYNCLRVGHPAKYCRGGNCRVCQEKHHTTLHPDQSSTAEVVNSHVLSGANQVLLATAQIKVRQETQQPAILRALLDSGSQASFITDQCAQVLGLSRQHSSITVSGFGAKGIQSVMGIVTLRFSPHFNPTVTCEVQAFVLPRITRWLPSLPCQSSEWEHLHGITLADPEFGIPAAIDVLLGADIHYSLMKPGRRVGQAGTPVAQDTILGWVLSGELGVKTPAHISVHTAVAFDEIRNYWALEDVPHLSIPICNDDVVNQHFAKTHVRASDGRYVVELPFTSDLSKLGNSRSMALRRLLQMERRLKALPHRQKQYNEFMDEYLQLGHMEKVSVEEMNLPRTQAYYFPHHAVIRDSSTTTKLRVVFDGTAKPFDGLSLNQVMMIGPKLQDDLLLILMRFRMHPIGFTADICKMYRQIWVAKHHCDYQRILWRSHPSHPIEEYRLLTVTYGTASAPYLATKCLQQLAVDESKSYPEACHIISKDFYVDDMMSGAPNLQTALRMQKEILEVMTRGGLQLRKWSSNHPKVLQSLPPEYCETKLPLKIDCNDAVKTLGIYWHPASDCFFFKFQVDELPNHTKRIFLSETAKVFDPLGWLSPVTVKAKIWFQKLWENDMTWDAELPQAIITEWMKYREQMAELGVIRIPRFVGYSKDANCQLHGFSDASEQAYAAVIYLRASMPGERAQVSLLCSRTRVAPKRKPVTLPRLELCGALLLAELLDTTARNLKISNGNLWAWTDSTIALHWIRGEHTRWNKFVANRVAQIQCLVPSSQWRHVPGKENPADVSSRGIFPSELPNHSLWWHGPPWLISEQYPPAPDRIDHSADVLEQRSLTTIVHHYARPDLDLLDRHSSWTVIKRITAFVYRFITNARLQTAARISGPLTTAELRRAILFWVRQSQAEAFASEIQALHRSVPLSSKSKILPLAPFLDEEGTLRVGGRLRNAKFGSDRIHPSLLPSKHRVSDLIIDTEHRRLLHAGPQLLLAHLTKQYWLINGRDTVRKRLLKCITCAKERSQTLTQIMADLPAARVSESRPFLSCGVDFTGPLEMRPINGRGKHFKAYVALFVCFSTRAVHLELVVNLTADAFIAALKRFISRRGKCKEIFSDCGKNFVGADRELKSFLKKIQQQRVDNKVAVELADEGINWNFNPPAAPHFGGLWEAGIKSTKHHLKRVIRNTILNYEEMSTILAQIEACLNSRPLSPISSDPNDVSALTPAHFLIGDSLLTIPEPDYSTTKVNHLRRWQLCQQRLQHFWKRWSSEYIARMQQRPKWWLAKPNLKVNDLVMIKEDGLMPLQWRLGRIMELHHGSDGHVRVVTVKTSLGILKRPVVKIALLPLDQ